MFLIGLLKNYTKKIEKNDQNCQYKKSSTICYSKQHKSIPQDEVERISEDEKSSPQTNNSSLTSKTNIYEKLLSSGKVIYLKDSGSLSYEEINLDCVDVNEDKPIKTLSMPFGILKSHKTPNSRKDTESSEMEIQPSVSEHASEEFLGIVISGNSVNENETSNKSDEKGSSKKIIRITNISVDSNEPSNETFTDSDLTFVSPQEFIFQDKDNLSDEILKAVIKNPEQIKNRNNTLKLAKNAEIRKNETSLKHPNCKDTGIEKFEMFKEIMEKLKKDISVIMNSEDLREDDSNTSILNKFDLLDDILKQLYFIGRSLSNGGTYFIESLTEKRKEVSTVLNCLREEVFKAYLKLQPDEKYFVARCGGPMGCIFTLFGVLEREVCTIFRDISNKISKRHSLKHKKLYQKKKFHSAQSLPILNLDFAAENKKPNEEIIVSSKDAATSMSGNFVTCPIASSLDVPLNKINIPELSRLMNILISNKASQKFSNSNILQNIIKNEPKANDSMKMIEKLIEYESEGFEICLIQNCIQITTPENLNFLIKSATKPLKMSEIILKARSEREELDRSISSIFTKCSGDSQVGNYSECGTLDTQHYTSARGDSDSISVWPSTGSDLGPSNSESSQKKEKFCHSDFNNSFIEDTNSEYSQYRIMNDLIPSSMVRKDLQNKVIISLDFEGNKEIQYKGTNGEDITWEGIEFTDPSELEHFSPGMLGFSNNDFIYNGDSSNIVTRSTSQSAETPVKTYIGSDCLSKLQQSLTSLWNDYV